MSLTFKFADREADYAEPIRLRVWAHEPQTHRTFRAQAKTKFKVKK